MKKITFLVFTCLFWSVVSFAQTNVDSLYRIQQKQITDLSQSVAQLEEQNTAFMQTISVQQNQIDSLSNQLDVNTTNLQTVADSVGVKIQQTNKDIAKNAKTISNKTTLSFVFIGIALIIAIIVAVYLHRRLKTSSKNEISKLKVQADELNGKIVEKLTSELDELKNISKGIVANATAPVASEPDHSLVKALADRITFMEMTLYKMDASVRGHKQLSRSIKQMKDNLLANGYELVDMLGKDYDDGIIATVNYNDDEEVEKGKRIITGIIKPQINYKGKMIQSAQITVSQNI